MMRMPSDPAISGTDVRNIFMNKSDDKTGLVLLAVVMVVGGVLFSQPWPLQYHHDLINRLGEALIIASILGFSVDLYSKNRLLHEVSRDVFVHIFGHALPEKLRDRINQLVRIDLVRTDCEIRYTITPLEAGRVQLTCEHAWNLDNYSSVSLDHKSIVALEKRDKPVLIEFRCDTPDAKASFCYTKEPAQNFGDVEIDDGIEELRATKTIAIQPRTAGVKYRVSSKCTYEFPENGTEVFSFGGPTIEATIIVNPAAGFSVSVVPETENTANRWYYRKAFLSGEHLRVRWYRSG